MLVFQIICLCFSLLVLQIYVMKGTYTRSHRLLPVVLALVCLYNFYEVVLLLVDNRETLLLLMDLLLIQFIYLLLYYVVDLTRTKLPKCLQRVLFLSLITFDILVFLDYSNVQHRRKWVMVVVLGYALLIAFIGTRAYLKTPRTRREHYVDRMLYIALLIAELGALCWRESRPREQMILSGALLISCGIVLYLILTNQLLDLSAIMQENLFDTAKNGIVLLDNRYYYLDANSAARSIFQKELAEEEKSRSFGAQNVPKVAAMVEKGTGELERGENWFQYQITPLVYRNKTLGYVLSMWEITDEKRKTRAMEEKKDFAEEQTRRKSRFLAVMSHDLRTPVHAIIGSCDILIKNREMSAGNRSLLQHIKNAGKILLNNVNDILLFSKLEAGKLELEQEEYSPEEILDELAGICVINLQSKPVNLTVHLPGEHPARLLGDEKKVYCMLQNILSNAVKYTEKGEIRCEMTFREPDPEGRILVTCAVSDTGRGMTKKQLKQAFEDYVTFSENAEEGTGLGLSIVHQLTGLMGGSVKAESDGKNGSTVTITYYQRMAGTDKNTDFLLTKENILNRSVLWKEEVMPSYIYPDARVLLADDMQINRQIFKELVAPWKVHVDYVPDGRAAVLAAENKEYHLIFLDRMMPEMSGNEAALQISRFSEVPLIAMTADLSDDKEEWRKYGFTDFLSKPVDMEILKRILERYLPEVYRKKPESALRDDERKKQQNRLGNRRTLNTFIDEAEDLIENFESYVEEDHALLQTKVHGLKGACRQIGQLSMGESAEIMEMAVKVENLTFVRGHMEDFLFELNQTIDEVKNRILLLPQVEPENRDETIYDKQNLWSELLGAFLSYDMINIDRIIDQLSTTDLTEQEKMILCKVEKCSRDFDYEEGISLLEEYRKTKEPE